VHGYGVATDGSDNAYATGYGGAFVAKVDMSVKTWTTLTSSPNPSNYGQAVTFTAVVTTAITGGVPNGETVTFVDGKKVLGTATLSGGSAMFVTSSLATGTHRIRAIYGRDSNFAGSMSKFLNQIVNKVGE
jgi:hypothetical protein